MNENQPGRFYRNVVTVEILSSEPWGDEVTDLETVSYEITDGSSIGYVTRAVANQELARDEAVATDIRMGGDGTFLLSGLKVSEDGEPDENEEI